MAKVQCLNCSKEFYVVQARVPTAKFCSYACKGMWRTVHWSGPNNPAYRDEPRTLICQRCDKEFSPREGESITNFRGRKFCSMECTKLGQHRLAGRMHPNWKEHRTRRKIRRGKQAAWSRAVISRDKATCQRCGATEVQLHAHHVKPFVEFPELRWEVKNGITLCYKCHWSEHYASNANGVNSGNIPPAIAEDNPEPSDKRKFVEGVTTRGRAYRRWNGSCDMCGTFISKPLSDTTGKRNLFCSRRCSGKFKAQTGVGFMAKWLRQ